MNGTDTNLRTWSWFIFYMIQNKYVQFHWYPNLIVTNILIRNAWNSQVTRIKVHVGSNPNQDPENTSMNARHMAKKRLFSLSRTMRVVLYRRRESATFCNAHWSSNASTPFRLIGAQCLNSFSAAKTPVHRKCQTHVTDFGYSILASNRSQTKTPLENLHMLIS